MATDIVSQLIGASIRICGLALVALVSPVYFVSAHLPPSMPCGQSYSSACSFKSLWRWWLRPCY